MPSPTVAVARPVRAVIFLTAPTAADIPHGMNAPACTQPFGSTTFLERVLATCAAAGLRELDLVACEHPETLRALAGDGWHWGLTLRWHLAKEPESPYGVLHTLGIAHDERVLIGHAHRWLAQEPLERLLRSDGVALRIGDSVLWTGWASLHGLFLHLISPHADDATMAQVISTLQARHCVMVKPSQFAWAGPAPALMEAQRLALHEAGDDLELPPTWIRQPWGAMSPLARVHSLARLRAPVLIGPGCVVERDAQLGPGVVLSRDVLVAQGAVMRDALVLPDTYVSGVLYIEHAVVRRNIVRDLHDQTDNAQPAGDARVAQLQRPRSHATSWHGRLVALLLLVPALPVAAIACVIQALRGRPAGWTTLAAVVGRDEASGGLRLNQVREPNAPGLLSWLTGRCGALLDVAQGRRRWFGVRPRDRARWGALRRDWQVLFDGRLPGFFHAPAWMDVALEPDGEALAAADAWLTVCNDPGRRLALLWSLMRSFRTAETLR